MGCTAGDYDNDGFADIASLPAVMELFHNEKNGTFKLVRLWQHRNGGGIGSAAVRSLCGTRTVGAAPRDNARDFPSSGLLYPAGPIGISFIDYDHDGDVDVYVTESVLAEHGPDGEKLVDDGTLGQSALWRNNGDGTFTDVTDLTGLAGSSRSVGAIGTDYNNDRAVDLLISGGEKVRLFRESA